MFDSRGKTSCHLRRSWHNAFLNPFNPPALLSGTAVGVSPYSLHLPFLHFKFLSSSPILAPPSTTTTTTQAGCAHYSGFACLLQSSMRGDETELPVAASAEPHSSDRKSSTLGPRHSQQTNAGFLKGPYTHTHTHQLTQRYSPKQNLRCTVFSLNIYLYAGNKLKNRSLPSSTLLPSLRIRKQISQLRQDETKTYVTVPSVSIPVKTLHT